MKKLSVFTLALVAGLAVSAQNSPQLRTPMAVETRFGVKAGVNMAKFEVGKDDFSPASLAPDATSNTSFNAGVFVNIPMSDVIRFQPELLYSGQGSKLSGTVLGTNYQQTANLRYLTLPLMFQAQTSSGFFVELGPQFGYLLSAKTQNDAAGANDDKTDIKDYLDKFDFAVNGGIGYMTRIGLGINARYVYGLTNVLDVKNNNSGSTFYTSGELKNRVIQVGLFYQFGANK